MAQENNEIKALGNIIPSMSLNKHINGVPNYSLHEAINMRMSDDRMAIQNIESIDSNEVIMNFLSNHYISNIYGELYYSDEKILNSYRFADIIVNNITIYDYHYDEQDLYHAIADTYANIDFNYTSINELIVKTQSISDCLHYPLDEHDERSIRDIIITFNIQFNPNVSNLYFTL